MEALAKPAIEVVRNKKTKFVPERFDKTYFNWMENIQRLVYIKTIMVGT